MIMGAGEDENVDDLVSSVCKDVFKRRPLKENFQKFLTSVKIPSGWEDKGYRLNEKHLTYKYRFQLLKNFIKSEGFSSTSTFEEFSNEIEKFLDLQSDERFSNLDYDQRSKHSIDFFEQNIKLQGVVVRKSDKGAYVLIKKGRDGQGGSSSLFELVVSFHDEGKSSEGFHLEMAEGDIVEVTKCRRKKGAALEPEIIKCFSLSETVIESFLNHLSGCVQSNGSSATVTEITRFHAAWKYILDLSTERYADQILEIIIMICSSFPMSHTVSGIIQGFQQSEFFRSVLPGFIDKVTEESKTNVSMVQKILEHVITAVPASGLQVLPMATILAQNLVKSSSDLEKAKVNGQSAVEFLSKLSTIIASEVPGARKDMETLPWKELPLIPDTKEIHRPRLKTDDLPVIETEGKYKSEEDYLETYFRLLREECFFKLRKGISEFVKKGQKCDSKDMMMYRVFLRGCSTRHENSPTVMLISLEYEMPESQDMSESENTEGLLYGNLLCISLDGSFQEPVWAIVEKHIAEQRIVGITLCDKANTMSEPQFIARLQEITNKKKRAFMAESQTFYVAYAPAMEILQHRDHVPFKEFLVYPDPKHMEPPEYIQNIKCPPDWEIIFEKESLSECSHRNESSTEYSLLNDFDGIRLNSSFKSTLDETQLAAVELALKNKLVLIQGPPGTGKSFVGVALVRLLLSMNIPQDHGPILVVTYKNYSLNNFLRECLRKVSSPDVTIVRVGRLDENEDEKLRKCLLTEVKRRRPNRLYYQRRKLMGQIWALQPKVRKASEKLRTSNRFSVDMFLEEASDDQLKNLVVDNEQGKQVTEEEVEALINEQREKRAKLRDLVENALKDWLPKQEMFDCVGEKKKSSQGNSSTISDRKKSKEDQDQENPSDFRDPSVEKKERLLAVDEEIADEEDEEIAKEEENATSQDRPSVPCLRNLVCLDEKEVRDFRDLLDERKVWKLNENERVQLVYVLQRKYFLKASSEFLDVSKEYVQLHHRLKELKNQQDIEVLKKCDVIGMTVTGATMRANLLADIKPSVMIVEEAAEILEGQLVAVIPPSVQHLIMIGDHKQLRPVVYFQRLKKHHHLDLSMFERLVNCKLPYKQLGFQCRMRDEFVDLLRELKIYTELKTQHELVKNNHYPACVESSMYFWTHTKWESESKGSPSKRNLREAQEITEVAKKFCLEGKVHPSKITVLCSYRGQVQEINSHFRSSNVAALEEITVTTIDSFQGQENDIILISLVRSNEKGIIGYLSSMNRLCVAISRARCGLYFFGNHTQLSKASSKGWRVVSNAMRKKGYHGSRFPFRSSADLKSPRHAEIPPASDVPNSSPSANVININAGQANVNIGGTNSVNTINVTDSASAPRDSPSTATSPPRSGFNLTSSPSGKIPVHDPMSPSPSYSRGDTPVFETRTPGLATKDARTPTQETPQGKKTLDSGEVENLKERPVQESANPKDSVDKMPKKEDPSLQELASEEVSKEKPVQETEEAKSRKKEWKDQPEGSPGRVLQEDAVKEDKDVEQSEPPSQNVPLEKPKDDTGGEQSLQDFEEFDKEKPLQETGEPGKKVEELSEGKPLQETASTEDKTDSSIKEEAVPTQETMNAGKVPFEEIGFDEEKAVQEAEREKTTDVSKNVSSDKHEGDTSGEQSLQDFEDLDKEKPLQETGDPDKEVEVLSEGKPLQESASSEDKTDSSIKEEALPTQETINAGKSPFEKIVPDKDKTVQATQEPSKIEEAERDTIGGTGKEVEDESEGKPLQETASTEDKTASSIKDKPLPTQETMSVGKSPFEKIVPDKEKALQQIREQESERENAEGTEKGKKVLPVEDPDETVESDSFKEEPLPTQETMAAGKGPFEETGLEVGVKAHPTDEQE